MTEGCHFQSATPTAQASFFPGVSGLTSSSLQRMTVSLFVSIPSGPVVSLRHPACCTGMAAGLEAMKVKMMKGGGEL